MSRGGASRRGDGAKLVAAAAGLVLAASGGASRSARGGIADPAGSCGRGAGAASRGWARVAPGAGYELVDLDFRSVCEGLLVGATVGAGGGPGRGVALTTTDAGRTLAPARMPRVGPLAGVAAVGHDAWAVGGLRGRAAVLASRDGGRTWSAQRPPPGAGPLAAVAFVDVRRGWAVGEHTIAGTTDGGRRWRRLAVLRDVSFGDVSFHGRRHGWAVARAGRRAVVLASDDAGRSWRRELAVPDGTLSRVDVVDELHVFAAGTASPALGGRALLVATRDGGRSWRRVPVESATSVGGLHFVSGREGWISVASGIGGEIRYTRDGGRRWTTQARQDLFAPGPFSFVGRDVGWMIGSFGLFATTDGGRRNARG